MHFCARQQWVALALGAVLLSLSAVAYLRGHVIRVPGHPPGAAAVSAPESAVPAPAPAASTALPVDVNRASAAELEAVPGIGPVLAGRILALRAERGRFHDLEELKRVKGIKDKRLARLTPYLTVSRGDQG
jgi:competence protein ComEA